MLERSAPSRVSIHDPTTGRFLAVGPHGDVAPWAPTPETPAAAFRVEPWGDGSEAWVCLRDDASGAALVLRRQRGVGLAFAAVAGSALEQAGRSARFCVLGTRLWSAQLGGFARVELARRSWWAFWRPRVAGWRAVAAPEEDPAACRVRRATDASVGLAPGTRVGLLCRLDGRFVAAVGADERLAPATAQPEGPTGVFEIQARDDEWFALRAADGRHARVHPVSRDVHLSSETAEEPTWFRLEEGVLRARGFPGVVAVVGARPWLALVDAGEPARFALVPVAAETLLRRAGLAGTRTRAQVDAFAQRHGLARER